MIKVTRPKLNRFKYAAPLLGALAVAAAPLASPAIATAEAGSGTWDIEQYDNCRSKEVPDPYEFGWDYFYATLKTCCLESGGVWHEDGGSHGHCVAPPADSQGSRQLPGNVQIPSDIATAPLTKAPSRPIQVPSDIATAQAVTQAPG